MRILYTSILCIVLTLSRVDAQDPLKRAVFTQVVNDVEVVSNKSKARHAPKVKDTFELPDLIQTGPQSRAELIAADKTVTRIGANTVFTFSKEDRGIDLKQGSVMFHSPTGNGGGTIRTAGAAAAVTGTTIAVSATSNGGFKVLVYEGSAKATLPNGQSVKIGAGQLIFIIPGGKGFSPVINFDVQRCVEGSRLANGFDSELPSMDKINKTIEGQKKEIQVGDAILTDLLVGDATNNDSFQVITFNPTIENQGKSDPFLEKATVVASAIPDVSFLEYVPDEVSYYKFYNSDTSKPNIAFTTSTLDLGNYSGYNFTFTADGDIRFDTNLTVTNYTSTLEFYAGGNILGMSGKTFASNSNLKFTANGNDDLIMTNTSFNLPGKNLTVKAKGNVKYNGGSLNANYGTFTSDSGSVVIQNVSFSGSGSLYATSSSSTGGLISLSNLNTSNLSYVNLEAHTINLVGVKFSSSTSTYMTTYYGWNVDGTSMSGYANFINSTYDNVPIANGNHGINSNQGYGQLGSTTIDVSSSYNNSF